MPMVVAQLNRAGLIKDVDKWIDSVDPSDTDYMSVVCDMKDHTIWLSDEAKEANIGNICSELPEDIPVPTLIETENSGSFIAYNMSRDREGGGNIYQLVVLRSGESYQSSLDQLHKRTTFYLGLFVLIAIAFLIAAFHWSFQPLRKLAAQLNQMTEAPARQVR